MLDKINTPLQNEINCMRNKMHAPVCTSTRPVSRLKDIGRVFRDIDEIIKGIREMDWGC